MPEYLLILIRSLLAVIVLLFLTRMMGKKQISHLTFFDYIVGITVGSIAATLSVDQGTKIINGLIGIIIWGGLPILISFLDLKWPTFRRMVDGHPTVLIENGKIKEESLRKLRIPAAELILLLREQSVFKLSEVEFAIMETNGQLSVMRRMEDQPITAKHLKMKLGEENEPRIVVMDGKIMEKTLKTLGYSHEWLMEQLNKKGIKNVSDVFLVQLESNGSLYIDLKDTKKTE